jgi:hypothetical protein
MLLAHRGPLVIEVNISPGLQGITQYTNVDVADAIAKYLYEQTKNKTAQAHSTGVKQILSTIEKVDEQQNTLITSLDFRGERVLLPEIVTKGADFKEGDDYVFEFSNGEVKLKRFDM